jgi:hypothetical protein
MSDKTANTQTDSPALREQSELYPVKWSGRVPKRIRMLKHVEGDFPIPPFAVAYSGKEYDCWVNSHGAVAANTEHGMLGVKPDEFEVIEFHAKDSL